MKLAFSTNAFTAYSIVEAIIKIGDIGYQGVEILADRPHLYPFDVRCELIDGIRESLDLTNLVVSNINANTASGYFKQSLMEPVFEPSLSNKDRGLREWRIKYTKQCIDLASDLGAKNISITSGRPLPGCPPEIGIENFKKSIEEIIAYGERKGISLGIEYEPGLLIESAEEILELMKEVDSDNLGVNLDVGHVVVAGEDPTEVIHLLSPWLFNIHIEDIKGRKHYHLIPGYGNIDLNKVYLALKDVGYERFVTVELYTYCNSPERAAKEAFQYLKGLENLQK